MTTNTTGPSGAGANGSSWGQKIRGAAQVAHGVGESVRGQFFDAVDGATNAGPGASDLSARGRLEAEQGMSQMTGTQYGSAPGAPAANAAAGTAPIRGDTAGTAPGVGGGVPAANHYDNAGSNAGTAGGVAIGQEATPQTARGGIAPGSGIPQGPGQVGGGQSATGPGAPQGVGEAGSQQQAGVANSDSRPVAGDRNVVGSQTRQ